MNAIRNLTKTQIRMLHPAQSLKLEADRREEIKHILARLEALWLTDSTQTLGEVLKLAEPDVGVNPEFCNDETWLAEIELMIKHKVSGPQG
jgi:hypothetical protein